MLKTFLVGAAIVLTTASSALGDAVAPHSAQAEPAEDKCLRGVRAACLQLAKRANGCRSDDLACQTQSHRWTNVVIAMDQVKTHQDLGLDADLAISRQQLEEAKKRATQAPTQQVFSNSSSVPDAPRVIQGTGPYKASARGWDRTMQTTMACGAPGWVRGSGSLSLPSGTLSLTIQLETDDTSKGPKGRLVARLKNAAGLVVRTATTSELATGGKPPGRAKIVSYSKSFPLPPAEMASVASLEVEAECTGAEFRIFDIPLSDVVKVLTIALSGTPTP